MFDEQTSPHTKANQKRQLKQAKDTHPQREREGKDTERNQRKIAIA